MVKDSNSLNKSDASLSLNFNEPKLLEKQQTQNIAQEHKEIGTIKSTSNNFRERSKQFIKKFCRITLYSTAVIDEEQNTSHVYDNEFEEQVPTIPEMLKMTSSICQPVLTSQDSLGSTSNTEIKLKGILKNTAKIRSYSDVINKSHNNYEDYQRSHSLFGFYPTSIEETSNDFNNLDSRSNSCTLVKHVTFSDEISPKDDQPVSNVIELSNHQEKDLINFQETNSVLIHSTDIKEENSINI